MEPNIGQDNLPATTTLAEDTTAASQRRINNIPYLITVLVMFSFGVVSIILVSKFRPDTDIVLLIGAVSAFIIPTTASVMAFMKSQETHLSVNSRLDQFIKNADLVARSEGRQEGRQEGVDSANKRNDELRNKSV